MTADGDVRTRQGDDGLVLALPPDGQDLDPARDTRRGRPRGQRRVGRDQDLGVARARGELRRELQGVAEVAPAPASTAMPSMACRTRARSVDSLTTMRALRSAAMTLTLPPVGRSLSASMATCLAAVSRSGTTSVAAMLAEVSMTRTMSRARPAGRSRNGRAASSARADDQQQLEQQQQAAAQLLPRRVGLDVGHEPRPQQRRRHDRLVAPQLEQVHRDDRRHEQQAEQRERRRERHRRP